MNFTRYRKDFPILTKAKTGRKPFVYLDSAATSQKPAAVIRAEQDWYEQKNANPHRGTYALADVATGAYERVRTTVAKFIHASSPETIVFTRGTTEGINLVVQAWAKKNLRRGDTVLLTEMEHHANIVPWQLLAQEKGLTLKYWPIDRQGKLALKNFPALLRGVRFLSLVHVSNVLGTINPVEKIVRAAHRRNIPVLIDAAQSVPHLPVNLKAIDPDFFAFSSHKMLGPTGVGVLYIKKGRDLEMTPYQAGGDMIEEVHWTHSTFKPAPWKFEAGTQALAQVAGLGAAIEYLEKIGIKNIRRHEQSLVAHAYRRLSRLPQVRICGPDPRFRSGAISFQVTNMHPHDLATLFDNYGICVRAGHHCAQLLHRKLKLPATTRISVSVYNTKKEIDYFISTLKAILRQWSRPTTSS
ncbi:MAG: SufS family cysteine desulfurase [Patescibacteria group bacterium]